MEDKKESILNNGQINQLNKRLKTSSNNGQPTLSDGALRGVKPYIEIKSNPDNIDTDKIIEGIIKAFDNI